MHGRRRGEVGWSHSWAAITVAPLLSTPGRLSLLLVGTWRKLVAFILVLDPEAEIMLSVTQPLLKTAASRARDNWTYHPRLGPRYWEVKGWGEAQECILGYRSVSVQPVNEPATQLSPPRLGPISGLGAMEHRNLRRGLCSEECLPECVSFPVLVWKLSSCRTSLHLLIYSASTACWALFSGWGYKDK